MVVFSLCLLFGKAYFLVTLVTSLLIFKESILFCLLLIKEYFYVYFSANSAFLFNLQQGVFLCLHFKKSTFLFSFSGSHILCLVFSKEYSFFFCLLFSKVCFFVQSLQKEYFLFSFLGSHMLCLVSSKEYSFFCSLFSKVYFLLTNLCFLDFSNYLHQIHLSYLLEFSLTYLLFNRRKQKF